AQGISRFNISKKKMMEVSLTFPSYKEQKQIGAFFTILDNLITLHQRKLDKLEKLKESYLDKLFPKEGEDVPELRFSGFTDPWEQREFADTFNFISNNSLSRANLTDTKQEIKNIHYGDILIKYSELVEGNLHSIPFIRKEVPKKQINKDFLRKGDIIFADAAEDETVGKCIEIKSVGKHPIVSGLHTIAVRSMIKFESGFLGYYLNSNSFHGQLIRLMQGTKIPSVSKKHISNTYLRYPKNLKEQEQIATFLKTMTNTIALHQRKLEKLEKIKEAFLSEMFV
ncbi:MAG: restriction endonuclease subunit S, partial [Clostridiaceae bacterium]|nr:restriction endonuclease subunit S [Clostridiaceae bacterium]